MDTLTNEALAQKRRKLARRLVLGGFAILVAGLLFGRAGDTRAIFLSYGALILGTILSWTGVSMLDRWVMPPHAEDALAEALRGMHGGWKLYNWVLPADHVLKAPWGLAILSPFNFDGKMEVRGDRWKDRRPLWRRLSSIGRRPVRNPKRLLDLEEGVLRRALEELAREEGFGNPELDLAGLPIEQALVITSPRGELDAEDPSTPVMEAQDLKLWLQREVDHPAMPPKAQRALREMLDEIAARRMNDDDGDEDAGLGAEG